MLLCFHFALNACSQTKQDSLIINSLSFLDNKFHMNFKKGAESILVLYKSDYFIYNKYYKRPKNNLNRVNIIYKLEETGNNSYSFTLKWASEIIGTFVYENGKVKLLEYMKIVE